LRQFLSVITLILARKMVVGLHETGAKFNCQLKFSSAFEFFTGQNNDPERRGIHPAFPAARLAERVPAHSLLRVLGNRPREEMLAVCRPIEAVLIPNNATKVGSRTDSPAGKANPCRVIPFPIHPTK